MPRNTVREKTRTAGKPARTEVECSNGLIFFEPPNELLVPIFCKPVIGNPVDKEVF
jgi:hypothetical protein